MPSPLGHVLASFVIGRSFSKNAQSWDWPKLFFLMLCGVSPDLDFIPGLMAGEIYRYHHQFSHSLLGAVLIGLIFWLIYGLWRKTWKGKDLGLILMTVMMHPLLDIFVADPSPPFGCPLFMPFSSQYFMSPWVFFERTSLHESVFEARNMESFLIELGVLIPWAALFSLKSPRRIYMWAAAAFISGIVILWNSFWVSFIGPEVHFEKIWSWI